MNKAQSTKKVKMVVICTNYPNKKATISGEPTIGGKNENKKSKKF